MKKLLSDFRKHHSLETTDKLSARIMFFLAEGDEFSEKEAKDWFAHFCGYYHASGFGGWLGIYDELSRRQDLQREKWGGYKTSKEAFYLTHFRFIQEQRRMKEGVL